MEAMKKQHRKRVQYWLFPAINWIRVFGINRDGELIKQGLRNG